MADEPIQFRRTTNPAPVLTSYDGTAPLKAGEPVIALAPAATKLWVGDGAANRLLLSTDLVNDAPVFTQGYLKLTGGAVTGPITGSPAVAAVHIGVAADPVVLGPPAGGTNLPAGDLQNLLEKTYIGPSLSRNYDDEEGFGGGAYLRFERWLPWDGVSLYPEVYSTWENRIITMRGDAGRAVTGPTLAFLGEGKYAAEISVCAYGGTGVTSAAIGMVVANYRNSHTAADVTRPALWVFGTGRHNYVVGSAGSSGTTVFIDHDGGEAGVLVESAGLGSRGLEIYRHPGAGSHLRLRNKPGLGNAVTAPEQVFGEIMFAGPSDVHQNVVAELDAALMRVVATEQWQDSPARAGSRFELWTTPNGTATPRKSFVVDHNGDVQVIHNGTLTVLSTLLGSPGGDGLPAGGIRFDVLTKNSAAAGDAVWAAIGVRPEFSTALGAGALVSETYGTVGWRANVAIGGATMEQSDGPNMMDNIAVGPYALHETVGACNVAVGAYALQAMQDGYRNTALGMAVLTSAVDNDRCVGIGSEALGFIQFGHEVIGIGSDAGRYISFGAGAARYMRRAGRSVFIGANVKALNNDQENEIVIGSDAVGNGSNTVTVGDSYVTALHTAAGLVLGTQVGGFTEWPTGGAKGQGTINLKGLIYIDGTELTEWLQAIFDNRYVPLV